MGRMFTLAISTRSYHWSFLWWGRCDLCDRNINLSSFSQQIAQKSTWKNCRSYRSKIQIICLPKAHFVATYSIVAWASSFSTYIPYKVFFSPFFFFFLRIHCNLIFFLGANDFKCSNGNCGKIYVFTKLIGPYSQTTFNANHWLKRTLNAS